jgi:hypothetical protein
MLNFWASMEHPFAAWYGDFPVEEGLGNPERQLSFLVNLYEAAERECVYQVVNTPKGYSEYLEDSTTFTYAQFLQAHYAQTGGLSRALPFSTTRLCYYDLEGELVEGDIEDIGKLLERLNPDKERSKFNMSHEVPVEIRVYPMQVSSSGKTNISYDESSGAAEERTISFNISLHSDIWFPWVVGWLEKRPAFGSKNDKYDNRELAQCHTPRLNRFISTVRELVLEYGGTWSIEFPPPSTGFYSPMVTEQGILLDGSPKDMSIGF